MVSARRTSILDEILDPLVECFTPDVARRIVSLALDPAKQSQIDDLAAKANEGLLSGEERTRYEQYIEAMDVLAILKAKARLSIARRKP